MTEPMSAPADPRHRQGGPPYSRPPWPHQQKDKEHEKWTSPPPMTCLAAVC